MLYGGELAGCGVQGCGWGAWRLLSLLGGEIEAEEEEEEDSLREKSREMLAGKKEKVSFLYVYCITYKSL